MLLVIMAPKQIMSRIEKHSIAMSGGVDIKYFMEVICNCLERSISFKPPIQLLIKLTCQEETRQVRWFLLILGTAQNSDPQLRVWVKFSRATVKNS